MKEKDKGLVVVTFLNRRQVDYLDKLGKDCFFLYGHKLARTKILSELVDLLMGLQIDLGEIDLNNEALSQGISRSIENEHKETI